jgi:hypothetical protein
VELLRNHAAHYTKKVGIGAVAGLVTLSAVGCGSDLESSPSTAIEADGFELLNGWDVYHADVGNNNGEVVVDLKVLPDCELDHVHANFKAKDGVITDVSDYTFVTYLSSHQQEVNRGGKGGHWSVVIVGDLPVTHTFQNKDDLMNNVKINGKNVCEA